MVAGLEVFPQIEGVFRIMFINMLSINMLRKKELRVLHSPVVALYQPYLYVKGLRELGIKTDYMVHNMGGNAWLARDCDFDLKIEGRIGLQVEKSRELDFFHHALDSYDIFHFHSGYGLLNPSYSLWGRLDELRYIKSRGKKIVMSWWGCDLRTEAVDGSYPYSACSACEKSIRKACAGPEKAAAIRKAFQYADMHLSSGDLVASYPQLEWIDNAIDCEEWQPLKKEDIPQKYLLPATERMRVYHSFGNSNVRGDVKGSREIRQAVERLQSEGYAIEFLFFDNVPNREIKYYQAQADIVVDQLRAGWYGTTAVECMAMGKPLITYVRPEVARLVPHSNPIIEANVDTIYDVLKSLLENPERISKAGQESREYACRVHHYLKVAQRLEDIYRSLG